MNFNTAYMDISCIDKINVINHFRLLWEQHSSWTRAATVSLVHDLPDAEVTISRLLRNPNDFAAALSPYFGPQIASRFADLLTDHLVIAAELITASKDGNTTKATDAERRWYANGDEIAVFLGAINPHWSQELWKNMIREHIDFVKAQASAMLNGDYQQSVNVYDRLEIQSLQMADTMAEGILRLFGK